jgi:PAS domain S-box-containing protein
MTPTEPMPREAFAAEYASVLQEYVSGAGEAALARAYELGRKAVAAGLGILELALVHHDALLRLPERGAAGRPVVEMAAQFFAESLSPFEMTLRSYQANARLLGLSEMLARQNVEIDRAREQLRTILDATRAVIYMKDADGRYLFVNQRFQEVFGLGRDQVIGRLDEEVLPPDVARTLRRDDARVLEARAPQEIEETLPSADGMHTYLSLKFPLLDLDGVPHGLSCVATDVTERKRADEAVQRAREAADRERQLKQALEARDQFLAITSHELKTPLTALELQVASLRRLGKSAPGALVTDERVQSKCETIVRQVDRMTVLINNLIDVGRITTGRLQLNRERVELGEVVRGVIDGSREAIEHSGSAVDLRAATTIFGRWDRRRLETVVANLVSNALKFGGGNPVEIVVAVSGDRATLTVRDHGIGITADDQQRIFGRFERAVSERHYGGFGVGLWVARQAVEAHGGEIRVRSEHGHGSEFTVELPLDEGASFGAAS